MQEMKNRLEIMVVACWRNRLMGVWQVLGDKRLTRIDISIDGDWTLATSDLLGPAMLNIEE